MKRLELPSQERLRELFDYDEGDRARPLVWRNAKRGVRKGSRPGCITTGGYVSVRIDNTLYRIHRLVWAWHGQEIEEDLVIDHIDGMSNCIDNLQQISQLQNVQKANHSSIMRGTASRYRGVYRVSDASTWRAQINISNKGVYIGSYATEREAAIAYDERAIEERGAFAQLNFPNESACKYVE